MKVVDFMTRRPVPASPPQPIPRQARARDLGPIPAAEDIGWAAWSPIASPSTLALITWRCPREAPFPFPDSVSSEVW